MATVGAGVARRATRATGHNRGHDPASVGPVGRGNFDARPGRPLAIFFHAISVHGYRQVANCQPALRRRPTYIEPDLLRQRKAQDEHRSCGNQSAHQSLINRRLAPPRPPLCNLILRTPPERRTLMPYALTTNMRIIDPPPAGTPLRDSTLNATALDPNQPDRNQGGLAKRARHVARHH
jgi:hypothetical protein